VFIYGWKAQDTQSVPSVIQTRCFSGQFCAKSSPVFYTNIIITVYYYYYYYVGAHSTTNCFFSTLESFLLLYVTLVRSTLAYASPVWNNIITDARKLKRIQRKFAVLCFSRFFTHISYNYASTLEHSKLHTLQVIRHHLDALFFNQVFLGSKFCPSLIDNSSLRDRLVTWDTSATFLWYGKIALPLDVQQLLIWRAVI
jgi:hypothetical protein